MQDRKPSDADKNQKGEKDINKQKNPADKSSEKLSDRERQYSDDRQNRR